jgi:hypothetical protein
MKFEGITKNEDGSITLTGIAARIGVQYYDELRLDETMSGGIYRTPESVALSVETLIGSPITVNHPENDVDESNWDDLAVGTVTDATYIPAKGIIFATLNITKQRGLDAIERGYHELSVGYSMSYSPKSGCWIDSLGINGEKDTIYDYDYTVTDIKCNHLALCEQARAGKVARLLISEKKVMNEDLQTLIIALQAGLTSLESKLEDQVKSVSDSVSSLVSKVEAVEAKIEEPKSETVETNEVSPELSVADAVNAELDARLHVAKATGVYDMMHMDAFSMMKDFMRKEMPSFNCDMYSEDAVKACFDMYCGMKKDGMLYSDKAMCDSVEVVDTTKVEAMAKALDASAPVEQKLSLNERLAAKLAKKK